MIKFIREFWEISGFFWKTKKGLIAIGIVAFLLILNLAGVGVSVYMNEWNVSFYNSIQNYDKPLLIHQLIIFVIIMAVMMTNFFITYLVGQYLNMYIRKPMTEYFSKNWLSSKYYTKNSSDCDNPEERMDTDIETFVSISKAMFLGLISNIASFCSFAVILWGLSGSYEFNIYGFEMVIHGYLFWIAVILAVINVAVIFRVGRPLKRLVYEQQMCEANFRYHLSSVRNNKQSVSDNLAEKYEYVESKRNFGALIINFYALMFRRAKLDVVNMLFQQAYSIIGTMLALPRYFAKEINFGQLMQVNSAISSVIWPVVWLSFMYENIAELRASMTRLLELKRGIDSTDGTRSIGVDKAQDKLLNVSDFSLVSSDDSIVLQNVNMSLGDNDSLLIYGPSGIGKSSLLRAINGINSDYTGDISFNKFPKICMLSQKPYFPEDDFKRAVFYPLFTGIPSDEKFIKILNDLGVGKLSKYLNTENDWRNLLSSGEQQRLNFCKIHVKKYDLLLLDESTSNVDEKSEDYIYSYIKSLGVSYISISHHERVAQYHNREFSLA